jgi:CubicO group peptidase (beta-lactamase class C family)
MTRSTLPVALALALLAPSLQAAPLDRKRLDTVVDQARARWELPGLAVAVVHGDEPAYLYGSGLRALGGKEPVTPDTLFAIASLTKAFTATGLGILVDEGKATWDDPVRKHLPDFRLSDPLADRDVTLRDLLCHRTGLARHDLLWYRAPWSLDETVRRMAFLEPASSFRSRYEYNNLAYIAAGMAVARASGMAWHDFTSKRIFAPLGMKSAVFTASAARASADHATPHRRDGSGKHRPAGWYPDDRQVRGSGSIKANVRDLSAWLRMQLNGGKFAGKQVISARALAETHRPQVVVPVEGPVAKMTESTQVSYGLGWRISDYRGRKALAHGGANDGFRAALVLVPDAKLGLVLLTNCEDAEAVQATANQLLDILLGLKEKDWHGFYQKRPRPNPARRAVPPRRPGTKPSLEQVGYLGTYADRAYGELKIDEEGKQLVLLWSGWRMVLEHYHYDTFMAKVGKSEENRRLEGELATFTLDGAGNVASVRFLGRTFVRAITPRR